MTDDTIADPHRKDVVAGSDVALDFNVKRIETVALQGPPALMERDLMSPYVWREPDGRWGLMVRAVVRPDAPLTDTGLIWSGWSDDGVHFTMLDAPSLAPGPGDHDAGGVEDPTVIRGDDGYIVYYSGVRADQAHSELSYATGPTLDRLIKSGVALASTKSEGNTKEATIDRTPDGRWRLFYEYAADEASRVGLAIGTAPGGPWNEQPTPFMPRTDSWDDWHLSTGPLLTDDPTTPVMFYNGATRDARWRIGWVAFDADYTHVVARGIQPLVTPPPVDDRAATDIAFAAAVVVDAAGAIWLYYSLEDRRLARALIRRS
ncbi:glycosidase [Sphingomonas sp. 8AM]|uniref:glycosidase n=1 Tax=Sphingomonas sp. 8AM TaxID=2653170 RepID=UPI0012F45658|nr:glycosidase [Sphingomonas sp. 8AM]VXC67320.1 Glycosidase [Sphingomonas sp. 8AM]